MANQITVFLDPAAMPSRLVQDQQTFDNLVAAVFAAFPTFGAQFNAGIANFNAAAAGSAYAIPYTVDLSGTTDVDPGSGKLRFDNAAQNLATTLRLDVLGTGSPAVDYTAMIDTFDASTSTVKGHIRIVKQGDASKFLLFNVTARAAPSGYRDISVTPVASSSANPFAANDAVLLFFQRTGDKGAPGNTASGFPNMVVITTTQSWVCPAGITAGEVTVQDGAQGGFSGGASLPGGKGGDAGKSVLTTLVPGGSYTCTIGAGSVAGNPPTAGGAGSFAGPGITTLTSANAALPLPGSIGKAPSGSANGIGGGSAFGGDGSTGYGVGGKGTNSSSAGATSGQNGVIIIRY
jgi:hypothetical protein